MFSGVFDSVTVPFAVYSTKSNIAKDVQRQELWNLQSPKELLNSWKPCTDSGNITVSTMEPKFTLSTAHHPETDGQTGIANKTLKNYLNSLVNYTQDDDYYYLIKFNVRTQDD